jgi:hypothetical protein
MIQLALTDAISFGILFFVGANCHHKWKRPEVLEHLEPLSSRHPWVVTRPHTLSMIPHLGWNRKALWLGPGLVALREGGHDPARAQT